MVKFLNQFSKDAKAFDAARLEQLRQLLGSFLDSCSNLPRDAFHTARGRFSPSIFEAVFVAACERLYVDGRLVNERISERSVQVLKEDDEFRSATIQGGTTRGPNVAIRLERARAILELDRVD